MEFNEGTVLLWCYKWILVGFFREKYIVRHVEALESWTPYFLCRSLLLSTTVLNDSIIYSKSYYCYCVTANDKLISMQNWLPFS